MNAPRFQPDDLVTFVQEKKSLGSPTPVGRFVVVNVLPVDRNGQHQYRLRPVDAGPQRVAQEDELTR